jgi:hypothetical protein
MDRRAGGHRWDTTAGCLYRQANCRRAKSDSNSNGYSNTNRYSSSECNSNSYSYGYRDSYSNGDTDSNGYGNADTEPNHAYRIWA